MNREELLAFDRKHLWHPYASISAPPAATTCSARVSSAAPPISAVSSGPSKTAAVITPFSTVRVAVMVPPNPVPLPVRVSAWAALLLPAPDCAPQAVHASSTSAASVREMIRFILLLLSPAGGGLHV